MTETEMMNDSVWYANYMKFRGAVKEQLKQNKHSEKQLEAYMNLVNHCSSNATIETYLRKNNSITAIRYAIMKVLENIKKEKSNKRTSILYTPFSRNVWDTSDTSPSTLKNDKELLFVILHESESRLRSIYIANKNSKVTKSQVIESKSGTIELKPESTIKPCSSFIDIVVAGKPSASPVKPNKEEIKTEHISALPCFATVIVGVEETRVYEASNAEVRKILERYAQAAIDTVFDYRISHPIAGKKTTVVEPYIIDGKSAHVTLYEGEPEIYYAAIKGAVSMLEHLPGLKRIR